MKNLPDPDALLVALVVAPGTYSRNKFFSLFETPALKNARRKAQLVRSIVRDLTEPWPHRGEFPVRPTPRVLEESQHEGKLHLTYVVDELGYKRRAILSAVEAAAMRYALCLARNVDVESCDRETVETCLARLAPGQPPLPS